MSKSIKGGILTAYTDNPSILGDVIRFGLKSDLTPSEVNDCVDACELLNAQITDAFDFVAEAVTASNTISRVSIANTLNLLTGAARLNHAVLSGLIPQATGEGNHE